MSFVAAVGGGCRFLLISVRTCVGVAVCKAIVFRFPPPPRASDIIDDDTKKDKKSRVISLQ